MEDYYASIFFLLIFLQDQFKGFLTTIVCLIITKVNILGVVYLQDLGFTFYESCMFYEALVFMLSIYLIGCRIGVILCLVSVFSFFLNFIGYLIQEHNNFYIWYYQSYGILNIILFEVLVWGCLINSRLKPYIKDPNKVMRKLKAIKI